MHIAERVAQIRAGEHERLRQAVFRLDSLLRGLAEEEAMEAERAAAVRYDLFGERVYTPPPIHAVRRRSVEPLMRTWAPLEDALLSRLDRWEEQLWPLCQRWMRGEAVEEEIRDHTIAVMDARTRLESFLREFRNEVLFFDGLRDPVRALVSAIESSDRAEDLEVIPALLAGIPEISQSSATPRSTSSDEVARNLRAKVSTRPPEPPPKKGLARWLPWSK
jgi:hypothetical protein